MNSIFAENKNCWKLSQAEKVEFIIDGEDYFRDVYKTFPQAENSIFILGWDIDSEVELLRNSEEKDYPHRLGPFLNALVQQKPNLHIYILIWDFYSFFALEREFFPLLKWRYLSHDRIHFCLDDQHPIGASHHQKVVVIDERIAYCGGLDLTRNRWDTNEHLPEDHRRKNPRGSLYRPFHDVQIKVEGEVAKALGELARSRWQTATGEQIMRLDRNPSSSENPSSRPYKIAISRTLSKFKDGLQIREAEQATKDLIAAAKDILYIENQFLNAHSVGEALLKSLEKKTGPEIIILLPHRADSWLEDTILTSQKRLWIARLYHADQYQRLGVYYVSIGEKKENFLMIHSKVIIADDVYARVGSTNFTNRSMGLDSECDLTIDASGDPSKQHEIKKFRLRLLGELLDLSEQELESAYQHEKSILALIKNHKSKTKFIEAFPKENLEELEKAFNHIDFFDPEKPLEPESFLDHLIFDSETADPSSSQKGLGKKILLSFFFLTILVLIPFAWKITAEQKGWDLETVKTALQTIRAYPLTPIFVFLFFVIGGTLFIPLNFLIIATASIFPSWQAILYILGGGLICAMVGYGLGKLLGRHTIEKFFPKKINTIGTRLSRRGTISVLLIRIIPVAPFAVINLLCGTAKINFKKYLGGTFVGLLPGTVLLVFFQRSLLSLIFAPDLTSILIFVCLLIVLVVSIVLLKRRFSKTVSNVRND